MRFALPVRTAVALVAVSAAGWFAPVASIGPDRAEARSSAQRVVQIARGELARGVREVPDGSNRGPRIRMYGLSTTPRFYPAPWCAYFVSWAARRAGRPLGPAGRGFGYVPYIRAWARATGRWRTKPRSGDLVMFPHHVGLVETVYRNGMLTTIEGNSSNRVARRWRRWAEASGYVRFAAGGRTGSPAPRPKPQRPAPQRLTARMSVYPSTTVAIGQNVDFSATDSSGDIAKYQWDLDGDGRYDDARGDAAARVYGRAGTIGVGLRVTDRSGRRAVTRTKLVVRANAAPVAKLILPRSAPMNAFVLGHAEDSHDADGRIVRYEWDMDGDGRYETGGDHHGFRYSRPGTYVAGLRVTDDAGAVSEAATTIKISQRAPVARVSAPSSALLGQLVTFDGTGSYDPDGPIATLAWDFDGDGASDAEGRRSSWRFSKPGTHRVRLRATDEWGAQAETFRTVNVINRAPNGAIDLPARPLAAAELEFDGSRSSDPDSAIVRYQWDFDADWRWDAEGVRARWTYSRPGTRKVRLRLTDEWGAVRTVYRYMTVLAPPTARLSLVSSEAKAGAWTAFNAVGSHDEDGYLERFEWDFDSNGTVDAVTYDASRTAWFLYPEPGARTATVTVTDDDGLTATATLDVGVVE